MEKNSSASASHGRHVFFEIFGRDKIFNAVKDIRCPWLKKMFLEDSFLYLQLLAIIIFTIWTSDVQKI